MFLLRVGHCLSLHRQSYLQFVPQLFRLALTPPAAAECGSVYKHIRLCVCQHVCPAAMVMNLCVLRWESLSCPAAVVAPPSCTPYKHTPTNVCSLLILYSLWLCVCVCVVSDSSFSQRVDGTKWCFWGACRRAAALKKNGPLWAAVSLVKQGSGKKVHLETQVVNCTDVDVKNWTLFTGRQSSNTESGLIMFFFLSMSFFLPNNCFSSSARSSSPTLRPGLCSTDGGSALELQGEPARSSWERPQPLCCTLWLCCQRRQHPQHNQR